MELKDDKPIYGVWIPKVGWLRGKDIFADHSYPKAKQVTPLIGRGAIVRLVDESIVELEKYYLEQEQRSIWAKLKSILFQSIGNLQRKK